jgi:hypothetical protein
VRSVRAGVMLFSYRLVGSATGRASSTYSKSGRIELMGYCHIRVVHSPFMRRRSGFEGKAIAFSSAGPPLLPAGCSSRTSGLGSDRVESCKTGDIQKSN